jgi:hypothetical protein
VARRIKPSIYGIGIQARELEEFKVLTTISFAKFQIYRAQA